MKQNQKMKHQRLHMKVQKENIEEWRKMLEEEVTRLTLITMQITHRLVTKL